LRLQAVVALHLCAAARSHRSRLVAADFPTDKFLDYALNQAVFSLKPHWLEPFQGRTLKFENSGRADRAAASGTDGHGPDTLAGRCATGCARRNSTRRPAKVFLRILTEIATRTIWP